MYHPTTGYELSTNHQAELRQEVAENRLAHQGEEREVPRRERPMMRNGVTRVALALMRTIRLAATWVGVA